VSEGLPAIEMSDRIVEADADFLRDALIAENEAHLGVMDYRPLALVVRERGRLLGGLHGETARGLLYIDMLWLAADQRRRGLGSRLLLAAEAEARRRGCRLAWLDTYDFQARPFYERRGYRVFAELDGLPNGRRRFFMRKSLEASAGAA
jgi:GNAT superfamily N-acetyltransferase